MTGPTGSGKSTTLAALIDHINSHQQKNIITIEDPIEFPHKHKRSVIQQREVGVDTHSFAAALKSVLRQAPDVILVGEMRDYETIKAALTGHLVMGTMHTNSAAESMNRIIDVFPEEQQAQVRTQLSSSLVAVMTQQVVPNIYGNGRVLAYELMLNNTAVAASIREGKVANILTAMQTSSEMMVMDQCLAGLAKSGVISQETARAKSSDVPTLNRFMSGAANLPRQAIEHGQRQLAKLTPPAAPATAPAPVGTAAGYAPVSGYAPQDYGRGSALTSQEYGRGSAPTPAPAAGSTEVGRTPVAQTFGRR